MPSTKTPEERFWPRVEFTGFCWLWTGHLVTDGYGSIYIDGKSRRVHRVAYEWLIGPIPEGLVLDHLCRVRRCVNPDHLEPVTDRVNILRGTAPTAVNALKIRCTRGHELTPENTYMPPSGRYRACLTCIRLKSAALPRKTDRGRSETRTHCPQGHPYDAENTRLRMRNGSLNRECRACDRARNQRRRGKSQEPAWSLDPDPRPYERVLSDDVDPGDLG